jgi:hypothetical protein
MDTMLPIVLVAFFAVVTAMHMHLTSRRPLPMTLWTADDIDAE